MFLQISELFDPADCPNPTAARHPCNRKQHGCLNNPQNLDASQGNSRSLRWLPGVTYKGKRKHNSLSIQSSNPIWQPVDHVSRSFRFKPGKRKLACVSSRKSSKQRFATGGVSNATRPIEGTSKARIPLANCHVDFQDTFGMINDPGVIRPHGDNDSGILPSPCSQNESTWQEDYDSGHVLVTVDHHNDEEVASVLDSSPASVGGILSTISESTDLLTYYDIELCSIPFTHDFPDNPLRCGESFPVDSTPLLYAVLAYSLQHLCRASEESPLNTFHNRIAAYKHSAASLCLNYLSTSTSSAKRDLLDTMVILFALDALRSSSGPWNVRLSCAYARIESLGGLEFCSTLPRARAHLMMFVWWDCSIALVARSDPIFPSWYYEFALNDHINNNHATTYDFFTISGMPRDLFQYCRELSQIASEKRQVAKLKHATFNLRRVNEIEQSIRAYVIGELVPCAQDRSSNSAGLVECWHDYYNAVNAWKYAILLYIARVIKWDSPSDTSAADSPPVSPTSPSEITSLARLVLDSVRCCRPDSAMQKQLLFPVLVAGSETHDSYARGFVRAYCDDWYRNSRYMLFKEAAAIMEEVWLLRDGLANNADGQQAAAENVWWGSVIDSKQEVLDGHGFLFG